MNDEKISAFALNVGRELEKLVEERNNNLTERLQKLEASVFHFRQQIKGNENMLKLYDLYFNIEQVRNGN